MMMRINEIIEAVQEYNSEADVALIMKAYVFSAQVHAGQVRRSGEPYLSHPLSVAALMAEMHLDVASICAALLHDAVEDSNATVEDVIRLLGKDVAELVDGVTKITKIHASSRALVQAESLRKMILAMARDIRVLLLKLADRLHNMRTLGFMPEDRQKNIAQETLDIYAPMANRLGIRRWQVELEDLSFYYLDQGNYKKVKDKVASSRAEREEFVNMVKGLLAEAMAKYGIRCRISGRPKHFYSIYLKTLRNNLDVDDLYDLLAFRVIVPELKDCYEALGVVHSLWRPIPGRFRDYIGMPKSNMYQSLHASVLGPLGQRMEVQIRTEEMHMIAEEGIAAHWQYKEKISGNRQEGQRFAWLRQLIEDSQKETVDASEFMRSLRMDLYPEEIFVFTPQGEVKELPKGSTPIDFAYSVHSQVGHNTVGAKVNGRIVPLRHELNTGDQVEIITNPQAKPNKDWLKMVVSGRARSRISAFVREDERGKSYHLGREILDREMRKHSLSLNGVTKDGRLNAVLEEFNFKDLDQLSAAVAYAKISPRMVVARLLPKDEEKNEETPKDLAPPGSGKARGSGAIKVRGVEDVLTRFARCCTPLPGEAITGFITRGRGISVHRSDCPILLGVEHERLLEVQWDDSVPTLRPVKLQMEVANYAGVFADIAQALKTKSVNIEKISTNKVSSGITVVSLVLDIKDSEQLKHVLADMRNIKGVVSASRASL
ncbi:MAG: bifunctional (p)ppGpp synthetase/guanosine-3',5'-bis(diphosphate) 3'-pyrophosphohydrolase [Desulfarculales bacterium]|jgi:GTP pyrophosphokinase|nr:bifunctional (p)ppGpp synthetase/guanosine-3',5'-bis(diphosphate) 3'-pyrophosphohydrolase [Desulfarculales bacterium]